MVLPRKSQDEVTTNSSRGSLGSLITTATAGTSRSKKSRSTVSSRASTLLRIPSFSRSRTNSDLVTLQEEEVKFSTDDVCETISRVTVRVGEALESELVTELNSGTVVRILQIGELPRRARIDTGSLTGWISIRTKQNFPLLVKRTADMITSFEVGGRHQVLNFVTLREGEHVHSEILSELPVGTAVRILEIGSNPRRAKVSTIDHGIGWISLSTSRGDVLVGQIHDPTERRRSMVGSSEEKIKVFLESARRGDLQAMKKACSGGVFSRSKFDAGCSDIRGRTALMYAAACGHLEIVEYLIFQQQGVSISAMDDTQKVALHYAARRAARMPVQQYAEKQQALIQTLLDGRASPEACDHRKCTPLMLAAACGDMAATLTLLKAGTNVHAEDYEGTTALDYATKFGNHDIVKILINAGAKYKRIEDAVTVSALGKLRSDSSQPRASFLSNDSAQNQLMPSGFTPCPRTASVDSILAPAPVVKDDLAQPLNSSIDVKPKARSRSLSTIHFRTRKRASAVQNSSLPDELAQMVDQLEPKPGRKSTMKTRTRAKPRAKGKANSEMPLEPDDPHFNGLDLGETVDAKTAADRLAVAVADSSSTPRDIEHAIKVATVAGVDGQLVHEAQDKLKSLAARALVLEQLHQCSVEKLSDLISEAEKCGVGTADIEKAKGRLSLEMQMNLHRKKAREMLDEASNSGSVAKLKIAIEWAQKAKLASAEIVAYEDTLQILESKEKAIDELRSAMDSKDVCELGSAILHARELDVEENEIAAAEEVLHEEELKSKARQAIWNAMNTVPNRDALESAINNAKKLCLHPSEYAECEDMLRKEMIKDTAMGEVWKALGAATEVDMFSIPSIARARDILQVAMQSARKVGVGEGSLKEADLRRRKLHNAIEDLKGSVRVFCRFRPINDRELCLGDEIVAKPVDGMTVAVTDKGSENLFAFDAVFMPGSQEEVFADCQDLVRSAFDGYNVTIFAYGQTGAGKTYTMGGSRSCPGISRRTINEVFNVAGSLSSRCDCEILGSVLELYRQDMRDLLVESKNSTRRSVSRRRSTAASSRHGDDTVRLQIRAEGVEGLSERECHNADELSNLLDDAMQVRVTSSTAMNSDSSRSHLLFGIKVISVNRETQDKLEGKIMIVDLAGSERLSKSQVVGEDAKDAIEINKSLTALGDVIAAVTKGSKQIPYRNHKLTMLMQDAIGGSAKTLMFVNCSPAKSNVEETVMSLKYATRAKKITNSYAKQRKA